MELSTRRKHTETGLLDFATYHGIRGKPKRALRGCSATFRALNRRNGQENELVVALVRFRGIFPPSKLRILRDVIHESQVPSLSIGRMIHSSRLFSGGAVLASI